MEWLLRNYLEPILDPAIQNADRPAPLRPLSPLLSQYKPLMKIVVKDTTSLSQHQSEIDKLLREIERWIGEAKVDASVAFGGVSWAEADSQEEDETIALERLSEELLQKGALVPVSRKYGRI